MQPQRRVQDPAWSTSDLNSWYTMQAQISPVQFLSQTRQSHIITGQQYQALLRDRGAQAEFTETYKRQLGTFAEYDKKSGSMTAESLRKMANLKSQFRNCAYQGLRSATYRSNRV